MNNTAVAVIFILKDAIHTLYIVINRMTKMNARKHMPKHTQLYCVRCYCSFTCIIFIHGHGISKFSSSVYNESPSFPREIWSHVAIALRSSKNNAVQETTATYFCVIYRLMHTHIYIRMHALLC